MSSLGDRPDALQREIDVDLPEFDDPPADPLKLLQAWIDQAYRLEIREPMAFVLATADAAGSPSSRTVLLKEVDDRGIVFGTHRASRKGRDLAAAGRAAGTLYWRETLQQVNVAGTVEPLGDDESDALFAGRSPAARATTAASRQGEPLEDPADLHARAERLLEGAEPVARPDGWGGYRLVPDHIEFWHGSTDRLHRRLAYTRDGATWTHRRLQP